jgi:sulfur carrier protein
MSSLKITVNGELRQTKAETLAELCEMLGYANMKVATALNGSFVPATARAEIYLDENDRVEIVAPRQGG